MDLKHEAPAAVGAAGRGNNDGFRKRPNLTPSTRQLQLVGKFAERIVALDRGLVAAWAAWADTGVVHVHTVANLQLDDPALAGFRKAVGCSPDVIACRWGAP